MKDPVLGISDYKKIIEEKYAYVDKTLFIQEIYFSAEVSLIPRPRRFGKTTNLSMLYYFFSNREEDNTHLFQNYKIWDLDCLDRLGRPCRNLMGQFPVIFLTLKEVNSDNFSDSYEEIKLIIIDEFEKHRFLLNAVFKESMFGGPQKGDLILSDTEKKQFESILNGSANKTLFKKSFKYLIEWLYRYYGKRVIVLIDEYDAPIHAAYLHGYFDEMIDFMRNFFGASLKDNAKLEKAIITGILRISKENIFSGFNNVTTYSLLNKTFGDKFGFLEKEVEELLKGKDLFLKISQVREWYNGYSIGGFSLYNPWSITQYMGNKEHTLQPYWVNVSSNELIKRLLWTGSKSLKKDMENLLLGQSILKEIPEGIIFSDLKSQEDVVWSLFFFSGYLTLASEADPNRPKELIIPNREILELFKRIVQNWLKEYSSSTEDLSDMLQSLVTGEVDVFAELFQKLIINAMSSHDLPEEDAERVYHAFTLGLLVALEKTHEVKSNRESGFGRYDVCLIPKNPKDLGVVIEFKKVRGKETLNQAAELALDQIAEKKYVSELNSRK
ncbi:MAG: AAA family ATPase, partial [Verrucomicrobia bacterium]|nr:AAA family ATPase [Verrucomicrobiota bacterium]